MKIDDINELITRESVYSITHPLYIPDSRPNPVKFFCYPEYSNPELSTIAFTKRFPWWELFLAILLSSSSCIELADTKQSGHKSHHSNIQTSGMSSAVKRVSDYVNKLKSTDVRQFYQVLEKEYSTYFNKHTPNVYTEAIINLDIFNGEKVYRPKSFSPRPHELMYTLTLAHCSYAILEYVKKILTDGLGIVILLNNQPVPFMVPKYHLNTDQKANSSTSKKKNASAENQQVFILTTTTTSIKFQSPEQQTAYLIFQEILHWCYASDDFSLDAFIHYLPPGQANSNNIQNYIAYLCQVYHKYWLGPDIERIFLEKYTQVFANRLQKILAIQSSNEIETHTVISNTINQSNTDQQTDKNVKSNNQQQYYKDFPFLLTGNVLTYWLLLSGTAYQTPYHVTHKQEDKNGTPLKMIEILSSIPFEHFSMLFYQMHDIAYSRPDIEKSFASKVTFHAFPSPYLFNVKNREKDIIVLTGNFYAGNGHYLPDHQFLDIERFYNGKDLVGYYCPFINGSAVITEDLFPYFKSVLNMEILLKFKETLSKDFLHFRILFDFLGDVTKPSREIASTIKNKSTVPSVQDTGVKTKSLEKSLFNTNSNKTTQASSKSSEIPLTATGEVDLEKFLLDTAFNSKDQNTSSTDTTIEENIPKSYKDIKNYATNKLVCKVCLFNNTRDCHAFKSQYDLLKHIFFQHLPAVFLFCLKDLLSTSKNFSLDLLRFELLEFSTNSDTKIDDIGSLEVGLTSPVILENLKDTSKDIRSKQAHKAKELQHFNTKTIPLSVNTLEPFRVLDLINHDILSLYETLYNPKTLNVDNIPPLYEGFLIFSFIFDIINVQELKHFYQGFYENLYGPQGINNDLITHFKEYIKELHIAIVMYLQKEKNKVRNINIYTKKITKLSQSADIDFSDKLSSLEKVRYNKLINSYKKKSKAHPQDRSLKFSNPTVTNTFNTLSIGPYVLIHIKQFKLHNSFQYVDCDILISNDAFAENIFSLLKIIDLCYKYISVSLRNKLYFMYYVLFLVTHPKIFDSPDILQNERLLVPDEPILDYKSNFISISGTASLAEFSPKVASISLISEPTISGQLPEHQQENTQTNTTLIPQTQSANSNTDSSHKPTQKIISEQLDEFLKTNKTKVFTNISPPSHEFMKMLIINASKHFPVYDTIKENDKSIQIQYLEDNKIILKKFCIVIEKFKIGNYFLDKHNQFQYINDSKIVNLVTEMLTLISETNSDNLLKSTDPKNKKLSHNIKREFLTKYTATSLLDLGLQLLDVIGEYVIKTTNPSLFTTQTLVAYGFNRSIKSGNILAQLFRFLKDREIIVKKSYYLNNLTFHKTKISFYVIDGMFNIWDYILEKID